MATAGETGTAGIADALRIEPQMVVQELGWDEDADSNIRASVEKRTGRPLLDGEAAEAVDVVLLWWRDADGDLVDGLMDATGSLTEAGVIWVLTPKAGREGYVEPNDIAEAVPTAGLARISNISLSEDWMGTMVVPPTSKAPG
ncbi:DUF3052 domain-containing protein [Streptomyces sp. NPDC091371]|uniref:DUF3052 domain-containing protein n=1 Tax=Streptomyces sp. NPDC091371 TaxID=3155303 RepID=UPI0034158A2B